MGIAPPSKKSRTSLSLESTLMSAVFFFAMKRVFSSSVYRACTMNRDSDKSICKMGNEKLLAKLSEGDKISWEKYYNLKCMTNCNNQYRKL